MANKFLSSPFESINTPLESDFKDIPPVESISIPEVPKAQTTKPIAQTRLNSGSPRNEDIVSRANELGIDPNLALSFFSQESGGNWNSKNSPKGAKGGMQVMPATYKM